MKLKINITKDILRQSMYCTNKGKITDHMIGQN